jgi:fibronectin-binding autotransporter adhesin
MAVLTMRSWLWPAALLALLASTSPTAAQTTYTWTGLDADDNWFSPLNWSAAGPGSPPPLNNLNTTFVVLAGNTRTTNVLDYSFSANSLTCSAGAAAFTVGTTTNETLTLGVGGITIASGNSNNQTFNANLAAGADQTWANNGTGLFAVGGAIDTGGFLLTVGGSGNSSFSGVVSGAGSLAKTGAGTLTLASGNTFTGTVRVSGGTLSIAADTALGAVPGAATPGKLTLDGGTLSVTTGFTLSANRGVALGPTSGTGNGTITVASGQTLTYGGIIANNGGTGVLVKTGAGTLVLSGNSTFSGGVVISGGVLQVPSVSSNTAGAPERLGAVPSSPDPDAVTISNGAVLRNTQTGTGGSSFVTANRGITLGAGGGVFDLPDTAAGTFLIYGGTVAQGANALTKTGAAILALSGTTTGTGALNINQGMVRLRGSSNRISDSSPVTIAAGAALDMATFSDAIGSLAGAGNVTFGAGTGTLIAGGNNSSTSFSGVISGAGSFTKAGSGTLTLTGGNTYTGATTINAGTLAVGTGGSLAAGSAVTVNNSGTLAGTGVVNGAVAINAGGAIRGDVSGGTGTLTIANNLTLGSSSIFRFEASRTGPGAADASDIDLIGSTSLLNLNPGSGNTFAIQLVDGANPLVWGESYQLTLATVAAAGNIRLNGTSLNANDVIAPGNYTLQSPDFSVFSGVSLAVDGAGTGLVLTFTPLPEPAMVLGIAAGVLAVGAITRRGCFLVAATSSRVLLSIRNTNTLVSPGERLG